MRDAIVENVCLLQLNYVSDPESNQLVWRRPRRHLCRKQGLLEFITIPLPLRVNPSSVHQPLEGLYQKFEDSAADGSGHVFVVVHACNIQDLEHIIAGCFFCDKQRV